MKLLLIGSLLVVLGVVAWAAFDWVFGRVLTPATEPITPVVRFVDGGRDGARRPTAIVWQTSTGPNDCAIIERRRRDETKQLADLLRSASDFSARGRDDSPCAVFQLGEVEHGAKVEVLGECGDMARIRIASGRLRGREGCIDAGRLSGVG